MTYTYACAYTKWDDEEYAAIDRVRASGQWTQGPEVAACEEEFAAYHGMKHGIAVNSGSSANLVAVAALCHKQENSLRPGDKVLVPAIAWATTYAPLVQYGLDLVVADCDQTWNAKPVTALAHDCRLILGCSILGNPAYLRDWKRIADYVGAYFIEDNCESLGAQVGTMGDLQRCGTFGLLNTFSFFYSHQISAIEGGMILTNDDELADLCRMIRNHGWTRGIGPAKDFDHEYDFVLMGYNLRWLEMHAAIARAQLPKLEEMRRARQQNLNNFVVLAEGLPIEMQKRNLPGIPSPFGIAFSVESRDARTNLVNALRAGGIDCRLPTGGSFLRHAYSLRWQNQSTPTADRLHDTALFLGLAPFDILPQMRKAIEIMKKTL